jgi:hypothetical protein
MVINRCSPYEYRRSGDCNVRPAKTCAASAKSMPRSRNVLSRFAGSNEIGILFIVTTIIPLGKH